VGVFVGREAELRTLVDSATAGHAGPAAVLVLGEPGGGKSRLLEEASNRLARSLSALDRRRPDRESDRAGPAWRGVRHADVRPAPPRLDFTDRERFDTLAPAMGQTFLIGDGKGRRFVVPANATRLYVGFADAAGYQGPSRLVRQ
jgi:AAA ATPase domain